MADTGISQTIEKFSWPTSNHICTSRLHVKSMHASFHNVSCLVDIMCTYSCTFFKCNILFLSLNPGLHSHIRDLNIANLSFIEHFIVSI